MDFVEILIKGVSLSALSDFDEEKVEATERTQRGPAALATND